MATPPEQPWTSHEKNYLLAEIIKSANPPAKVLFDIIRSLNIQPRWEETPLPPGRSLNSCRYAFEDLRKSLSVPAGVPIASNAPTSLSGTATMLKRPYQYEGSYGAALSGREIRPKPSLTGAHYSQPSPAEQPPVKRKRGRPTKAEALAKAEAVAASSSTGQNDSGPTFASRLPPQPIPQTTASTSSAPLQEEAKLLAPASTAGMPIAAMLTPTARAPQGASQSQSSSSPGRRKRATKPEPEESPGSRHGYESPYASVEASDTPARTAALRHREEPRNDERSLPRVHAPAEH